MGFLGRFGSSATARLDWKRFDRTLQLSPRADLERLGSEYGGYTVPVDLVDSSWICYSGGVGEDASFDLALIERFGCTVFAFDPTPRAAAYGARLEQQNPKFRFFAYGVAERDQTRRFHAPRDPGYVSHSLTNRQDGEESFVAQCRSLESLMAEFGHERVDLLKLDIEGAEYEVLSSVLSGAVPRPRVICLEFHKTDSFDEMAGTARHLAAKGYSPVHHDRLVATFVAV